MWSATFSTYYFVTFGAEWKKKNQWNLNFRFGNHREILKMIGGDCLSNMICIQISPKKKQGKVAWHLNHAVCNSWIEKKTSLSSIGRVNLGGNRMTTTVYQPKYEKENEKKNKQKNTLKAIKY